MKKIYKFILLSLTALAMMMCGATVVGQSEAVVLAAGKNQIAMSSTKETMYVGDKLTLSLDGCKGDVVWASSKSGVAKVSKNGVVTAKKAGTATITAIYDGEAYTCKITVKKAKTKKSEDELSAKEVYKKCCNSVVEIDAGDALGSGFFIAKNRVVTNFHVIENATKLTMKLLDGTTYEVLQVLGYDEALDLAVLKVDYKGVPMAQNSHGVTMGETTYTIGSSLGLTNTFSNGMVTNTKREFDGVNYIQTNTAISHGNSGGPLINAYGEVMGVTTSSFTEGQNLNLAINISQLKKVDTKNPMSVNQFINRKSQKKDTGTKKNQTTNKAQPKFTGCVYYGEEANYSSVCIVTISNKGKKKIVVGGNGYGECILVYPYTDADYTTAYIVDPDTYEKNSSVTIKAGDTTSFFLVLEQERFFADGASVGFVFAYDGVEYLAIINDTCDVYWDVYNK